MKDFRIQTHNVGRKVQQALAPKYPGAAAHTALEYGLSLRLQLPDLTTFPTLLHLIALAWRVTLR